MMARVSPGAAAVITGAAGAVAKIAKLCVTVGAGL